MVLQVLDCLAETTSPMSNSSKPFVKPLKSKQLCVYNSGFSANIGWISAILQKNDLVLYDALCHASIRDGLKMSPAKSYKFRHNDLSDLKQIRTVKGVQEYLSNY